MSFDTAEIRQRLLETLDVIGATAALPGSHRSRFLAGDQDVTLRELNVDSLARMELMVFIETDFGVIVTPTEFARFRSLGQIADHVQPRLSPAVSPMPGAGASAGPESVPETDPYDIRLFKRVLRICRTVAQLHKVLGTLEHRLTPLALATLDDWHQRGQLFGTQAAEKYRHTLSEWLDRMRSMLAASGRAKPEPFTARRVSPVLKLFSGPGSVADKTLIICFSTKGGRRLLIPNAVLLQHLDARRYDVLVVGDPWGTGFRAGVPLLGRTAGDVVESVASLPGLRDYRRIRTLGYSAGGYPALLMGYRLQAELIVSVGGRFPAERHVRMLFRMLADIRGAVRRGRRPRVILAYGADRSRDRNFARIVSALTGAVRLEVSIPGRRAAHWIFRDLLQDQALGRFLELSILARMQSPLLSGEMRALAVRLPEIEAR